MDFKPQIETLLKTLKNKGVERSQIEEDLGYSENYIDQMLAKGGNKRFLVALQKYVLQKTTPALPPNGQQTPTDTLTGANVTLQDYINELRNDKAVLYSLANSILDQIKLDTKTALAYQMAWVEHEAERQANGDEQLKRELIHKMNKLVRSYLLGHIAMSSESEMDKKSKA